MDEYNEFQPFEDYNPLILKFESMLLKGESPFFDTDEYEEIIEHYIMTNLDHAEMVVEHALSQYPWSVGILLKKAIVAAHRERTEEAFEIIDTVKSIDSNSMDLYVTISYIHRIGNKFKQSIAALTKALSFNEDVEEVYFDIAEDYFMLGDFQKETDFLKKCLSIKPDYNEAIEKLFWSFRAQNDFQSAVNYFQEFTESHPLQQAGWEKLGFSYYELGLFEKSVEAFEYSLSISDRVTSITGIAHAYWKLELQYQAIAILLEGIEKFPYVLDLNILVGWLYLDVEDFQNAQKYFLNEIFIDSSSHEAWKGLAQTYIHFKDYNNAYNCISKVVLHSESDLDSLLQLAYLADEIELPSSEVEAVYKKGLDKFPTSYRPFVDYSAYLYESDRFVKAVEILENALKTVDDLAPIYYRLAAYNYLEGRETIGHLHLIAALNSDPSRLHLLFDYNLDLIKNESLSIILESYTNNDIENEDI